MMQPETYWVRQPMANAFVHGAHHRNTSDSVVISWKRSGYTGIGECAPRRYVTSENCESVLAELSRIDFTRLDKALESSDPLDRGRHLYEKGLPLLPDQQVGNNTYCLIEMAVLDTLAQQANLPMSSYLSRITEADSLTARVLPSQVNINQVLDLSQRVASFIEQRKPVGSLKVKLANEHEANIQRLMEINALSPELKLYVDPNMSWSSDQLRQSAEQFHEFGVALFEEPLPRGSLEEYRSARLQHGAAIMLDESVTSLSSLHQAWQAQALDAVNLRVAKCGGLLAMAKMIAQCGRWNLPVYLGVQVAEVGPLIAAHRALVTAYDGFLDVEAGQHDRFFNVNIMNPMPAIDRDQNAIVLPVPSHSGLGHHLTSHVSSFFYESELVKNTENFIHMERVL